MRVGVHAFLTDTSVDAVTMGREVEARGFDSLWLGEHSHLPVGSVHPATGKGEAPTTYRRFLDPFLALSAIAATTTTLRVGTSVALPAEHHPIHFAKQVASLDHLSGGRLDLGVGYGWNMPEMANLGIDRCNRRAIALEHLRAAKELWTRDVAEFDGEFVSFTPSWAWPKPVQAPHPPIYIGGPAAGWLFDDVVAVGDGWLPVLPLDADQLRASAERLAAKHAANGRGGDSPKLIGLELVAGIRGATPEQFALALPRASDLMALAREGLGRLVVSVPAAKPSDFAQCLDAVARLRDEIVQSVAIG